MGVKFLEPVSDAMSDEPWYESTCKARPLMEAMASRIARKLGASNCKFEPFDLGHQLGALYANPRTGKRHAMRLRFDAGLDEVDGMVDQLRVKTNG